MARQRKKSDLPSKICLTCGRPFTWRKKWADCWLEVKYCSNRCRNHRPKGSRPLPVEAVGIDNKKVRT